MDRQTKNAVSLADKQGVGNLWRIPEPADLDKILFVKVSRRGTVDIASVRWVWEGARSKGHPHITENYSLFAAIPGQGGLFPVRIVSGRDLGGLVMEVYHEATGDLLWSQPAS